MNSSCRFGLQAKVRATGQEVLLTDQAASAEQFERGQLQCTVETSHTSCSHTSAVPRSKGFHDSKEDKMNLHDVPLWAYAITEIRIGHTEGRGTMRAKLLCAVIVLGLILGAPAGGMAFTFDTIDYPLEVVGPPARCEIAGAATLSTITLRHAGRPDCTARSSAPPTSAALVTSSPYAPKAPTARS